MLHVPLRPLPVGVIIQCSFYAVSSGYNRKGSQNRNVFKDILPEKYSFLNTEQLHLNLFFRLLPSLVCILTSGYIFQIYIYLYPATAYGMVYVPERYVEACNEQTGKLVWETETELHHEK